MNEIIENLYIGDSEDGGDFWITQQPLYVTFNLEEWRIDIDGLTTDDMFFIPRLAELIEDARVMTNAPVLVHCHGGMDRAPFAVACYFVVEHGFTPEDAYSFVKNKRPQTIVHDDWMRSFYSAWKELNE